MAREIKTTPTITGKDAIRFYEDLEKNKNKVADRATLERINESVRFIQSIRVNR